MGVGASASINFRRVHFGVRVDELHDALDVFGNRRGFEVEKVRARDADVRDGLVDLEKLQAVMRELLAQRRGDLQREMLLMLPFLADEPLQAAAAQIAARQAGDDVRLDRLDDVVLVRGAEMLFHFFQRRQLERLRHVETRCIPS